MPTSRASAIPKVIDAALTLRPDSVLDIGIGFGKYGFLMREYLELWDGRDSLERVHRIDGIEACAQYVTDLQRLIYDDIFVGDALDVLPTLGHYDFIILADVLEHFSTEDGEKLLRLMAEHGTHVLVTTPLIPRKQGAAFGNDYETHRSEWASFDIGSVLPDTCVLSIEGGILITLSRGHE